MTELSKINKAAYWIEYNPTDTKALKEMSLLQHANSCWSSQLRFLN